MGAQPPSFPKTEGRLDSQLRRSRLRASLFQKAQNSLKIGRFVLLERVGAGNMGEVYAAYDENLDRKVAIKLVLSDFEGSADANQRLLREAKTLAQLSHPHVVQVYDVGVYEERVFIAMEFIRGKTMTQWLKLTNETRDKRYIREILDRFIAAGKGLAAGHDAGLTHRDFKPDNILVSDDGRVVLADFGLARANTVNDVTEESPSLADPRQSGSRRRESNPLLKNVAEKAQTNALTPRGTALGTPAYMAPEVYDGAVADSRSDQFSFCVSLYEALYGERPFQGGSPRELRQAIEAGRVLFIERKGAVPTAVRKVLVRGLSKNPAQRFPSMTELLRALEHRPARWLIAPAIVVMGLAVGALAYAQNRAPPVCASAPAELAAVWRAERRDAIQVTIAETHSAYAADAWPLVERGLETYANAWTAARRDACLAQVQGQQSARLVDARMTCLERRLVALDSALAVLAEINVRSLERAPQLVQNLPRIDDCSDTVALSGTSQLPDDPVQRQRLETLRKQLIRAEALESSGRYSDAMILATSVVAEADVAGHRPFLAECLLVQGRTMLAMGKAQDAVGPLQQAVETGLELGFDEVAVESWARLVFARGTTERADTGKHSDPLAPASVVEAIGRRLPASSFARALLYNNLGAVYMARQNREQARDYFARAVTARKQGGPAAERIELIHAAQNLAMVTESASTREDLMAGVARELSKTLGLLHPQTMRQAVHYASYVSNVVRADELLTPVCERYRKDDRPELQEGLSRCLYLHAFLKSELGEEEKAATVLEELRERMGAEASRKSVFGMLSQGYAFLYRTKLPEALAAFAEARAALPAAPTEWWLKKDIGDAELGRGLAYLALSQHVEAIASFEKAIEMLEGVVDTSYNAEYQLRLARTRWELARVLVAHDGSSEKVIARARSLTDAALSWYGQAGRTQRTSDITQFVNTALKGAK